MLALNLHFYGLVVAGYTRPVALSARAAGVQVRQFLPRFLGVWLVIGSLGWVILSLTGVLLPQYYRQGVYVLSACLLLGRWR